MDVLQYVTNNGQAFFACGSGDTQDNMDSPLRRRIVGKRGIYRRVKEEDLISKWVKMYKETK